MKNHREQDGAATGHGRAPGRDINADLRSLADFAGLVTTLTGRFVNLDLETLDDEVNRALREIGEFAAVDRSYVFLFSEQGSRVTNTHEWCAPGIAPAKDNIQDIPVEAFDWAMSRVKRGEVLYVERVQDLPPDATSVKVELERQGVEAMINLPLSCAGKVLGFVGFDSVRRASTWTDEHIKLLKVVGEIIAGTIERNRATQALRRQVEMESLVVHISTRFINVPVGSLDPEINRAIAEIGRFTGVDRSYVFQLENGGRSMSNTHEWCANGIEPQIDGLQGRPVAPFGYCMSLMRRGRVFYVPDVGQLPAEAGAEKAQFETEGIKTLISVPILLRGEMIGFLGLDAVRRRRVWTDDDVGLLRLVSAIFANALDRASTEKQLQCSVREKELLIREIHHRVKNNMQIIASLLYLQAHTSRDKMDSAALEAFNKSQNRIKAMAAVHDRLYRAPDLSSIDFGEYLRSLAVDLLKSYGAGDRVKTRVEAAPLHLTIDQAIPCGLIVNELLTNCLKHAFPDARLGTIDIRLQTLPDGRRELAVVDDGVGFVADESPEKAASMGLTLVHDLAEQLHGEVLIEDGGGTRVRVHFSKVSS